MSNDKITVNPTCIVWQSEDFAEITPHPTAEQWHASIELESTEDGAAWVIPAMTLPATRDVAGE